MNNINEHAKNIDDMFNIFDAIIFNKNDGIPNSRFLKIQYAKIEAILLYGVTVRGLANILNENNFSINAKTLKTELFRIRKKLGKKSIREQTNEMLVSSNYKNDVFKEEILKIFNAPIQPYKKYKEQ